MRARMVSGTMKTPITAWAAAKRSTSCTAERASLPFAEFAIWPATVVNPDEAIV